MYNNFTPKLFKSSALYSHFMIRISNQMFFLCNGKFIKREKKKKKKKEGSPTRLIIIPNMFEILKIDHQEVNPFI